MRGSTNAMIIGMDASSTYFRDMRKERGVSPSADLWSSVIIQDKNGNQMGQLSQILFPDGAARTAIGTYNGTNNAFLNIQINADGTVYVFAEKTVNGVYSTTQIATF